jgi:hypothetical protein
MKSTLKRELLQVSGDSKDCPEFKLQLALPSQIG